MLSLAIATASSSEPKVSTVSTGPNDSFCVDAHRARAAVEDGGQVVEAVGQRRVVGRRAATAEHGALGQAGRDVRRHLLAMCGADQGSGLGLLVERTAEADVDRPLDEGVHEPVVERLLDQQARAGGADLAGVQEDRGERVVEGHVDVGVGEDDVGVLAAELEGHPLHGGGGRGHHRAAGLHAPGERDQVDPWVGGQRRTRLGSRAEHEVADAGRETGLLEQSHQDGWRCAA